MTNEERILELLEAQQGEPRQINVRLDGMDARFDRMDARLDGIDARFDRMDARLDGMDARFDKMDARLDGMDARFDGIDAQLVGVRARLNSIDTRLDKLEEDAEITRDGVNALIEWAENVSNAIRFPLPKLK